MTCPTSLPSSPPRRRLLAIAAAGLGGLTAAALAQPARPRKSSALRVTQILDLSADQQELARDYSTGVRAAFAELKEAGADLPQLVAADTDGSQEAVAAAVRAAAADPAQAALLGVVGEQAAVHAVTAIRADRLDLPVIAPWLADSRFDAEDRVVPLFASRERQIEHVLRHLSLVGVTAMGLVYPDEGLARRDEAGVSGLAGRLGLSVQRLAPRQSASLLAFGAGLPAGTPYFLVFMGGSIELAQFVRGLRRQRIARYVICLSEVDPGTFAQIAAELTGPVVFTQVVPNPRTNRLPLVRAYQHALQKYFDEPPAPMSLAGYIAGRYAGVVFSRLGGNATRAQVLDELKGRRPAAIDGWPVDFADRRRGSDYVDQLLLNASGKYVGA